MSKQKAEIVIFLFLSAAVLQLARGRRCGAAQSQAGCRLLS